MTTNLESIARKITGILFAQQSLAYAGFIAAATLNSIVSKELSQSASWAGVPTAVYLLAGAFSESTVIGTAGDAIQKLSLPDEEKQRLINNIPVAYAVTYLIGTTANVWFLTAIAPKLLRVNLKEEGKKLAKLFSGTCEASGGINSAYREWLIRAFIAGEKWKGLEVSAIEKSIPGARFFIERIRKNGLITEPEPGMVINQGMWL